MTDVLLLGLGVALGVACYSYWTEHAKAIEAKAGEDEAWRVANNSQNTSVELVERTIEAEAELAAMRIQHDNLQILYCDLVRRTLAANSWIVFQNRGKVSE